MNALDSISVILCLTFTGLGFYHGLIKSVSSLIAIIAGLYCAKRLEPFISTILSFFHMGNPKGALGYLFVFFCIFITVKIVLLLLRKATKASGLSTIDRIFGGLLGFAKGVIIIMFICTILQLALPRDSAFLKDSSILPHANKVLSLAHAFLPDQMYRYIHKGKI